MRSPIYAAAVAAFVFVLFLGGAVALAPRTSASAIVDVQQSGHNVTELQNLTVYVEVAATSSVRDAYFTFCQLQAPDVCFQPITMVAHNATWFVGETKQMSTYYEMVVGMQCGYNVTVDYKNGTNVTEPSGPNSFAGLTVIKTVAGYYDYEMTVVTPTYGLSGVISDSKTGTGIAGARVTLTPKNNTVATTTTSSTGAYGFAGLPNGTYSLSATENGYRSVSQTVKIVGANLVTNIMMSNDSTPPTHSGNNSNKGIAGFLATPLGWGTLGAIAVIIVAAALVAWSRTRKRGGPSSPEPAGNPSDASEAPSPGPK